MRVIVAIEVRICARECHAGRRPCGAGQPRTNLTINLTYECSDRIHKLHKADGAMHLWLFLLFLLFLRQFISRGHLLLPRKSWTADGLANARTAVAPAVLSLFSAVTAKGA